MLARYDGENGLTIMSAQLFNVLMTAPSRRVIHLLWSRIEYICF